MAIGPILLILIVVGFALWLLFLPAVPINPTFKQIIAGVLILFVIVMILQAIGLIHTGIHF